MDYIIDAEIPLNLFLGDQQNKLIPGKLFNLILKDKLYFDFPEFPKADFQKVIHLLKELR